MATVSNHKALVCPLCIKRFITPRVLPCCHSFCEKCLGENIESQVQGKSKFMCPLCERTTVPFDSNLPVKKWAGAFPLNTLINSILKLAEIPDNGETDNHCDPCKTDGETNNAEVWCIDCQEKICSLCWKLHNRIKLLKHHTTVPIKEKHKHLQCIINFDQDCGRHRGKVKELFCLDHRELCCAVCVATDHRQCNDVRSIDDITRDQSQRSTYDYPSIIQDFRKLKTEMEKIMTQKKSNKKELSQEKDQILHDMDNTIDTIIRHLNKLRNTFRNETEQMYKETESSVVENQKNVQSFMTNIDNSSEILEVVAKNGTLQQKFTVFEHLRCQIMSHYNQLNQHLKDDVEGHFIFKENTLLNDLEEMLKSVGSVEVSKTSSATSHNILHDIDKFTKNLNSRTKIGSEMCAAQVEKVNDLMASPVTVVKSLSRSNLGRSTFLTGCTFLGNGRLVMCDLNNERLIELDDEYNIVKEYKTKGAPTDVAAGNKDNEMYIAVNKSYIYKCMLHTDLTIVSRIEAPSDTWGIALSGDNIIASTSNAVVILTQDGSSATTISKQSGTCNYVAGSRTQCTIYYLDNNDVVCRTLGGHEVFRYQHQNLKEPRGMYVDRESRLYICGMDSHNVHQVSPDGQRSRVIQLHSISKPWNVVLHPQKNQLLVTSGNEDTACEVYRLS